MLSVTALAILCGLSALLTGFVCLYSTHVATSAGLVDRPDGILKLHSTETPLIGGLAVLIPTFVVSLVYTFVFDYQPFILPDLTAASLILIMGALDDRGGLPVYRRFLALAVVVVAASLIEPLFIIHAFRFEALGVNIPLDPWAVPLTLFMVVGFVNAVNMADGINGQLLGSIIIWSLFIVGYLPADAALPFLALIASSAVALAFNLSGRLFSGSAGSYAGPLFIGLATIAAYRLSQGTMSAELPVFWFWLPVIDCLRLSAQRMRRGRSPFSADRNHFHHILLDLLTPRAALVVYLVLLAAPGVLALHDLAWGGLGLLLSLLGYAAIVVLGRRRQAANWPLAVTRPGSERIGQRPGLEWSHRSKRLPEAAD